MENLERYKHLNKYLKDKFGERTLKICIDGGFTCPNRDGTISTGGCIFCSEKGAGEHIRCSDGTNLNKRINSFNSTIQNQHINCTENITRQVKNYFSSYKAERANKFIAYFQNFTNTYDSIPNLKAKYDAALIDDRIVGLEIATRPDCINEEVCQLLKSYTDKHYVCVELGLQTSNDETGKLINRGYTNEQFTKAVGLLNKYNIDVVVHIMVGLPYESQTDLENTVKFLNQHNIQGLKIHSTYVIENTALAELYRNKKYEPISLKFYLEALTYVLTHISPEVVIHRISGDAPKDLLIAPDWNLHKKWVLNGIDKILKKRNLYQGMFFTK